MKNKTTHHSFLNLALRKSVIRRAIKIALIVGCILALINHGDRIVFQDMKPVDWFKILLSYVDPLQAAVRSLLVKVNAQAALVGIF